MSDPLRFPIQDFNAGIGLIVDDVKMLVENEKQAIREAVEKRFAKLDALVVRVMAATREVAGMPSILPLDDDDVKIGEVLKRLGHTARNDTKHNEAA